MNRQSLFICIVFWSTKVALQNIGPQQPRIDPRQLHPTLFPQRSFELGNFLFILSELYGLLLNFMPEHGHLLIQLLLGRVLIDKEALSLNHSLPVELLNFQQLFLFLRKFLIFLAKLLN